MNKWVPHRRMRLLAHVWMLFFCHLIFVTHHSSLIIHHSKIPCLFGTIAHFSSHNIFHIICGPHICHPVKLFLLFFFSIPKLTEPSEKKKKKNPRTWRPNQWKKKKKKKKKKRTEHPTQEKKGKKKVKRCGWILFMGPLCVFNYNIDIELWKLKTAKMCF